MGSNIVRNLGIRYISKICIKFCIKKISKSAPGNSPRHVLNWFFKYPWSHESVRIHGTDSDLFSELCPMLLWIANQKCRSLQHEATTKTESQPQEALPLFDLYNIHNALLSSLPLSLWPCESIGLTVVTRDEQCSVRLREHCLLILSLFHPTSHRPQQW